MIDPLLYPADAVRAAVQRLGLEELGLLEARERAHPRHRGGRPSVLAACKARREELERLEGWRAKNPPWIERPYANGVKHYTCSFCGAFTALSEKDMRDHQHEHHRRELASYGPPAEPDEPATVAEEG